MGEITVLPSPTPTSTATSTLIEPPSSKKKKNKPNFFRVFRSVFRSFPIFTPSIACKIPVLQNGVGLQDHHNNLHVNHSSKVTGTLFGYRKGRVSFSIQENPRCLPSLVVELAMQTTVFQKEMSTGMVRIALETEKRVDNVKMGILEEPLWTMYCKGDKTGYGVKREANEEDLVVMEMLRPVSMGAGVLPMGNSAAAVAEVAEGGGGGGGGDGEMAYMRAYFERVVGSRDSETFYMLSPEGNNGPEVSVFFVRV